MHTFKPVCVLHFGLLAFLCSQLTSAQVFTYTGQHGPAHWSEDFKRCSGKHQSPINIDELNVIDFDYTPLIFENFNAMPKSAQIINNGHTVMVKISYDSKVPTLRGGPLGFFIEGYQFEQFHFHWGENDTIGSEDLINNASFPAELHVVMRNLKYKDFDSALGKDDGLVVLAYFFQINHLDNINYAELTELLADIPHSGMSARFRRPLPLEQFISNDKSNYYTYIGSLTTPPCSEDVIWIDFTKPITLSNRQINSFRQLTADDHPLMNNFRPTQPLNDRKVYRSLSAGLQNEDASAVSFLNTENGCVAITAHRLFCFLSVANVFWQMLYYNIQRH